MQPVAIIDRGRGPELAGTRITVLDVLPYFDDGWNDASIALWMGISSMQVAALRQYFEENKTAILKENKGILAWIARGNSPEVKAKQVHSRKKLQAMRAKLRRQRVHELNGARNCKRR